MQQHDRHAVCGAFVDDIENKLTAAVLIHAISMDHRPEDVPASEPVVNGPEPDDESNGQPRA